jgi:hypothetical protein
VVDVDFNGLSSFAELLLLSEALEDCLPHLAAMSLQ